MDPAAGVGHNPGMYPTVDQLVEEFERLAEAHAREIGGDPVKARAYLERARLLGPGKNPPLPAEHVEASKQG